MSHVERKVSWHLVGAGTQPTTCETGPVIETHPPKAEAQRTPATGRGDARGDHARAADTPSPVEGTQAQPHSVRASLAPIAAPCRHGAKEPVSTPLTVSPGGWVG